EAVVAHFIPFVERVSPALASSGEVVGRDAGDPNRSEVFVQFEEVGASPDVGAVVVDEDGNVADELDAALRAVGAEGTPLIVKRGLENLLDGDVVGLIAA